MEADDYAPIINNQQSMINCQQPATQATIDNRQLTIDN